MSSQCLCRYVTGSATKAVTYIVAKSLSDYAQFCDAVAIYIGNKNYLTLTQSGAVFQSDEGSICQRS